MKTDYQSIIKQGMYSAKLTRLLAEENLGVEFSDRASTASFNPATRTLTFPYNAAMMDMDIHELFMFHEISHALHLPNDAVKQVKEAGVDLDAFNIVIDIRDERLIKEKFPGAIKPMREGYKKLLQQGFFCKGDATLINLQSFYSRLNVYAKLGAVDGAFVEMLPSEVLFYDACMKAETLDECIELAKQLMVIGDVTLNSKEDVLTGIAFTELRKEIFDQLQDDEKPEVSEADMQKAIDDLLQARSDWVMSEEFKQACLKNANIYLYGDVVPNATPLITCDDYYNFMVSVRDRTNEHTASVRELRAAIRTSVDSMVRVFESKKAAIRRLNSKVSPTGEVDINRVHRYKFDDRIFGSATKIADDKNHGYVILVDLSGSMRGTINSVVEQIIVLVEFFRRIGVKYKIIGFGMGVSSSLLKYSKFTGEKPYNPTNVSGLPIYGYSCDCLLEFMSSSQTLAQHNMCVYGLFHSQGFSLGSTPTGKAMLAAENIARAFFDQHRIQKRHLVVMTDGMPSDTACATGTLVVTDKVSCKTIVNPSPTAYSIINIMGKVLEYRYNIKMTSICIVKALSNSNTSPFIASHVSDKKSWTRNGYASVVDVATKNKVYFVRPFNVDTDVTDFDIDKEKQTSTQLCKQMLASMNKVKKSRAFLNILAEELS